MSFFGKSSGGEPRITFEHIDLAPEPRAAAPASSSSTPGPMLLAADSEVEGELRSRGAVRVEGVLRGGLKAPLVFLELGGVIEGAVTADRVRIAGTLRGTVIAQAIEVARTAVLEAELVYDEISIERGAKVRGLHRQREPQPEALSAAPATLPMVEVEPSAEAAPGPVADAATLDPSVMLAAVASTAALVAEAEAALQELAQASQAAAGAAAELADEGVAGLVTLEQDLRAAPERLLSNAKTG